MVAKWHVFKTKIKIWVNFGRTWKVRCWYILRPFGLFYCHMVNVVVICYILWLFWYIFPVLVCCHEKNLATLAPCGSARSLDGLTTSLRAAQGFFFLMVYRHTLLIQPSLPQNKMGFHSDRLTRTQLRPGGRVTRLGSFSPVGRLFLFGSVFLKKNQKYP
jgi:hypothetical protein